MVEKEKKGRGNNTGERKGRSLRRKRKEVKRINKISQERKAKY